MSQRWKDAEKVFEIANVPPHGTGKGAVLIEVGGGDRPFRVTAVVAQAPGFKLVQVFAGKSKLLKEEGRDFPVTGIYGAADVGETIAVYVENTTDEAKTFTGKLIGQDLVS